MDTQESLHNDFVEKLKEIKNLGEKIINACNNMTSIEYLHSPVELNALTIIQKKLSRVQNQLDESYRLTPFIFENDYEIHTPNQKPSNS